MITPEDQARLADQAAYFESDAPLPVLDRTRVLRGAEAAARGRQLLVEALGSEEELDRILSRGAGVRSPGDLT